MSAVNIVKIHIVNRSLVGSIKDVSGAVYCRGYSSVELDQPESTWYITPGDLLLGLGTNQWRISASRVTVVQQDFFTIDIEPVNSEEHGNLASPYDAMPPDTYSVWSVSTEFIHERVVQDPSPLQVTLEKGIYLENETRTSALLVVAHAFPQYLGFTRNIEAIDEYLSRCTLERKILAVG